MSEPEPMICRPGGSGTFFPLLDAEQEWPDRVRAMLYAALLIYVFLGVSIVADMFMESITAITSERRRVKNKDTGHFVTVMRWNPTVSNLTLMALGSSAPEILLSIMEMMNKDFYSGELGPSTIVGSAAFNLFCIIGVCIMSVPSPEIRAIKAYNVFVITAMFSIFAYLWLVYIVQVNSKDIIDPWEGIATLSLFPVLIVISYLADIGWLDRAGLSEWPKTSISQAATAKATKDIETPEERRVLLSKPICDLQGKVIRNANGVLSFAQETFTCHPENDRESDITVEILRCNGTKGLVTCKFKTERLTAVPGYDYVDTNGVLRFEEGESMKQIGVLLKPKKLWKRTDAFQVVLSDATGGVLFNPNDDGGEETCVATVTINHRPESEVLRRQSDKMKYSVDYCCNIHSLVRALHDWWDQIMNACFDLSEDDDDDEDDNGDPVDKRKEWSGMQVFMHIVSLPWKLLFAVVIPPVELSGGWVCFIVSLACIGAVTSLIIDLAELFGCVVGIEDSVVAITFVALGTSMPDLFASWKEAVESPDADASIVNVTGSNSVNVFLGIGIPWTMASFYWAVVDPTPKWRGLYPGFPDGSFVVLGGNLAFSVVVFTLSAAVACFVLWLRRKNLGGELGGPVGTKVLSGFLFCMLWMSYIFLSIWKTSNPDASIGQQVIAIFATLCVLQNLVLFVGGGLALLLSWLWREPTPEDNAEHGDSERQVLVPALKQRDMVMEDLASVLEQVECPMELREAVLDTDAFVQKLATVEGTATLNSAAMAFAIAQLRPALEADVYKLHGLAWEDFLPVLRKVEFIHVLRHAATEPKEFLADLEMGQPLEAAKEFFIAKLLEALRPSLRQNRLSDADVRAVGAQMVSADCFDQIQDAIEQPESVVEMFTSNPGDLSSNSQMGNICAMVKKRSLLQPAFEEKGLPWTRALGTVRDMCHLDSDINTLAERFLLSQAGEGLTATEEFVTMTEDFVTMTCRWAKEVAIEELREAFESIISNKNLTPSNARELFQDLQLKDLVSASEDLQSGKGAPEAVWAKLMRASHEAKKQGFVAQIKNHFETLPDSREKWMEMVPRLHQRPLAELQRAVQNHNNNSFLPRLLGRGSANEQDIDSMGEPFLSWTESSTLNGSRSLPWNSSRRSTRSKEAALEADLFKVVQGSHSFGGDLLSAAQGPFGGLPALDDGEVQARASLRSGGQHEGDLLTASQGSPGGLPALNDEDLQGKPLLRSGGQHEYMEHVNSRNIADQPMQANSVRMLDDAGQHRNPRNSNLRRESFGMLEDEGVEDLKNTWGKEADKFLADRHPIDSDDSCRARHIDSDDSLRAQSTRRGQHAHPIKGSETYNSEPGARPSASMGSANGMRDGARTISMPPRKSGDKRKVPKSSRPSLNGHAGQ